jgi:hypothetical protein
VYTVKVESKLGRKIYPACGSFDVANGDREAEPPTNPKVLMHDPEREVEIMPGEIAYVMNQFGKNVDKVMGVGAEKFWAQRVNDRLAG